MEINNYTKFRDDFFNKCDKEIEININNNDNKIIYRLIDTLSDIERRNFIEYMIKKRFQDAHVKFEFHKENKENFLKVEFCTKKSEKVLIASSFENVYKEMCFLVLGIIDNIDD